MRTHFRMSRLCGLFYALHSVGSVIVAGECAPDPSAPCGSPLASLGVAGITAFSNGNNMGQGCSCDGYSRFQCVEFVKRFYYKELDITRAQQWVVGVAENYYYSATKDVHDREGRKVANNKMLNLYTNKQSMSPPEQHDILVFAGGDFGHVAIIDKVTSSTVSIIEQNWSPTGKEYLPLTVDRMTNAYEIGSRNGYTVLGWLRPQNRKPTGSLDGRNELNQIFGWAEDPDNLSVGIDVHLYIDNEAGKLGASPILVKADQIRTGVGQHAFNWDIPAQYRDGQPHTVWAWGIDSTDPISSSKLLAGSPKSFTVGSTNRRPTAGFVMKSYGQEVRNGTQLDAVVRFGSTASVQFNGGSPLSFDPDTGGILTTWQWIVDGNVVASTPVFSWIFPPGPHKVGLIVRDNQGQVSEMVSSDIVVREAQATANASPLGSERGGHSAVLLASKQVLVAGGLTPAGRTATAELYDWQSDTWSATNTPMVAAREGHVATLLTSGKVLISGGYDTSGQVAKSAEIYDPDSKSFTPVGDMAAERVFHWVFPLSGGRAVAFSGGSSGKPVEFFHSITNNWVTVNSTPIGVHAAVQFPDGKIWLATGDEVGTQVALYDPGSNSFRLLNPRPAARRALTAVALQNGKVWMPGGTKILFTTTNLPFGTSELYDPNVVPDGQTLPGPVLVGDYAQGQMPGGYYPTTTVLPDGRVLFTGGSYSRGLKQVVRAEEGINIYMPGTNTATTFFPMKTPRYEHTATLLPTGQVLVVGGLIATTFTSIPTGTTEILTLQ